MYIKESIHVLTYMLCTSVTGKICAFLTSSKYVIFAALTSSRTVFPFTAISEIMISD